MAKTKRGKLTVLRTVSGDEQENEYGNNCQTIAGPNADLSISIGVEPVFPQSFNLTSSPADRKQVADYLKEKLAPLCDDGFDITILVGKNYEED